MREPMKIQKLVRDNIPRIIESQGRNCSFRVLSDKEYENALNAKLQEELDEFLQSKNVEELADLQEVIFAILSQKNISLQQFEALRKEKLEKNGGFSKRIFLLEKD